MSSAKKAKTDDSISLEKQDEIIDQSENKEVSPKTKLNTSPKDSTLTINSSTNPKPSPISSSIPCNTNTLFVGNLHRSITDTHLHKLFQPYGTIQRVFQVYHKENDNSNHKIRPGQPKGYAFVEYESIQQAKNAIQHLDQRMLLQRKLVVRPALSKKYTGNHFLKDKFNNANINVDPNQILDNGAVAVAVDPQQIKKEQTSLELKIQQVKMAIEAKQKKRKLPS